MWWTQFLPLVEIGLTDLPKSGGGGAADPPSPTVLNCSDLMTDYSVLQWAAKA